MNQITKYYIKRKLEKRIGQCGGIQGRQDHTQREMVKQYCRREKKNTTPRRFVSLSEHELSLRHFVFMWRLRLGFQVI